jgi:molybdopterin molybdotransferase
VFSASGVPRLTATPRPGLLASGRVQTAVAARGGTADLPWAAARAAARAAGLALQARTPRLERPVGAAAGDVLAADLRAGTDLPPSDLSAMDGWAVAGPGPWTVRGTVLAGSVGPPLAPGEATAIATGAWLPAGATAVLRREHGHVDGTRLAGLAAPGRDVRPRGQEARAGEVLLPAGTVVTPAVVALACAAGYDTLPVRTRARVALLVLGDELLSSGPPRAGRVRDVLGPALPGMVSGLGARPGVAQRVRDDADVVAAAVVAAGGDVVVTTGGTAAGPVDHVHAVLHRLGARLLVDGVAVRPGHPMLLARLADGRLLVGLPGNPLAAVSGVLTLLAPVLRACSGCPEPSHRAPLAADVTGPARDTRLLPVRDGRPSMHAGPAMLRGLAEADGVAVIPPGGAPAGTDVEVLPLPW